MNLPTDSDELCLEPGSPQTPVYVRLPKHNMACRRNHVQFNSGPSLRIWNTNRSGAPVLHTFIRSASALQFSLCGTELDIRILQVSVALNCEEGKNPYITRTYSPCFLA